MKILLLFLLALPGCALHYDRSAIGFWDQCVKADGWGISAFTPWGPFNMGRLTWHRNVNCEEDLKPEPLPTFIPKPNFIEQLIWPEKA